MSFFRRERSGHEPTRKKPIPKKLGELAFRSDEQVLGARCAGTSIASELHSERNEDNYFITARTIGVFDGISSYDGSDAVSRVAAEVVSMILTELDEELPPKEAADAMVRAFREAELAIKEIYDRNDDGQPLGTTAVVAGVFTDPNKSGEMRRYVQMAHAGDSRAYVIRNGELLHVSLDHSAFQNFGYQKERDIQTMIDNTLHMQDLPEIYQLFVKYRHIISSCLSADADKNDLLIRTDCVYVQSGDIVLLTSDGIHDNLTTDEIIELICYATDNGLSAEDLTHLLIAKAIDRSGEGSFRSKMDDMTAVVKIID